MSCGFQLKKVEQKDVEFAKTIHFSLILSPNYSPSGCFDKSLVNYFKQAQLLKVGDVLSINVKGNLNVTTDSFFLFGC